MKPQETKSTVLLKHHLKALKLPTIYSECEKVASRCARENVDHFGFLLQLCELERIDREKRAAEIDFQNCQEAFVERQTHSTRRRPILRDGRGPGPGLGPGGLD